MSDRDTWAIYIEAAKKEAGDSSPVVHWVAVDGWTWRQEVDGELVVPAGHYPDRAWMDAGLGVCGGYGFTLWTEDRVYFPCVYDGSYWVGSVSRQPCEEATEQQGGG